MYYLVAFLATAYCFGYILPSCGGGTIAAAAVLIAATSSAAVSLFLARLRAVLISLRLTSTNY